MPNPVRAKRGTLAQINAAAVADQLNASELYYITDIERFAVGTAANAYQLIARGQDVRAFATAAEYQNKTAGRAYGSEVWDALAVVALTDAATIAVDMNAGIDFSVTLAGNRTLGNPTNTRVGQRGRIRITQDATGSRTLSLASSWKTAGGSGITLSTAANAIDYLDYDVVTSTHIRVALSKSWPA